MFVHLCMQGVEQPAALRIHATKTNSCRHRRQNTQLQALSCPHLSTPACEPTASKLQLADVAAVQQVSRPPTSRLLTSCPPAAAAHTLTLPSTPQLRRWVLLAAAVASPVMAPTCQSASGSICMADTRKGSRSARDWYCNKYRQPSRIKRRLLSGLIEAACSPAIWLGQAAQHQSHCQVKATAESHPVC